MDRILRATAADGMIKMAVINGRDLVERAREIHGCTPTASAALGRTLCAASLLGNAMKEDDATLTIRVAGNGPIAGIVAVSDCQGNVRGYCGNPEVSLPLREDGKLNVGAAVGPEGTLTVSRDIGLVEPYVGSVNLVSGEIAEDVTSYLLSSDQVPSACGLGVLVGTDESILAAGGFIVQLMPGAEEDLISRLEDNIFLMDQLTVILNEDGAEEVFRQVLKGIEYHLVGEPEPVEYRCNCSLDKVKDALLCLDEGDLNALLQDGRDLEVSCQFCDKIYSVSPAEIIALREAAES